MSDSYRYEPNVNGASYQPYNERQGRDEHMDEVEKVLAGVPDVNMLAMLTRDVAGG